MNNITAARWTAIGLHVIVLTYGLVVGLATIGFDPSEAMRKAGADPALQRVLLLFALIVGGNLIGAVLLLTNLYKSFAGASWLLLYELVFLAASISLLALDYAVAVGAIVLAVLYVVVSRKRASSTL